MFHVNREIPLFSREIYFKSQAFARQRTGHPELVNVIWRTQKPCACESSDANRRSCNVMFNRWRIHMENLKTVCIFCVTFSAVEFWVVRHIHVDFMGTSIFLLEFTWKILSDISCCARNNFRFIFFFVVYLPTRGGCNFTASTHSSHLVLPKMLRLLLAQFRQAHDFWRSYRKKIVNFAFLSLKCRLQSQTSHNMKERKKNG